MPIYKNNLVSLEKMKRESMYSLDIDNSNDYKIIRRVVKKITIRDSWKKIYLRYKNL